MRSSVALLAFLLAMPAEGWLSKIGGVVVDRAGNPVAGARIEHTGAQTAYLTNGEGRFELQTNAPAVVVRKNGFQSQFLRTGNVQDLRIVLEPAQAPAACTLNPVPKAKVTSSQDIDSLSTSYVLETKTGPAAMRCGRGPMWSLGMPNDQLVWDSEGYAESVSSAGQVDAKGRDGDGHYWRYRGVFGDSCQYSKVDRETAAAFDCLLNPPVAK